MVDAVRFVEAIRGTRRPTFTLGTVTSVSPLHVRLDGEPTGSIDQGDTDDAVYDDPFDDEEETMWSLSNYTPAGTGERVLLARARKRWIVLGGVEIKS